MMSKVKDKVILITGGTSGIGQACTELFAQSGAKVVTMSIQEAEGKALEEQLTGEGHQCVFHFGDVSKEEDVKAAVDLAVDCHIAAGSLLLDIGSFSHAERAASPMSSEGPSVRPASAASSRSRCHACSTGVRVGSRSSRATRQRPSPRRNPWAWRPGRPVAGS